MLLLGKSAREINGITIYPDHENEKQFWYLSAPLRLTDRNGKPVFTFIKYGRNVKEEGAKGGGFVSFEVNIGLTEAERRSILSQLPANSNLAPVSFDKGTVKCVALDVGNEQILGASAPSLSDENTAIFSLSLTEKQTTILEQALKQDGTPIGVIYDLDYTAMYPSLEVDFEVDFKRVYEEFQASLKGQAIVKKFLLGGSIETGFQKLAEEGAIKIDIKTFSPDDEFVKQQRERVLEFLMDKLIKDWFEPTLALPQITDDDDKDDLPLNETTGKKDDDTSENTEDSKTSLEEVADAGEDIAEDIVPQAKLKLRYVRQEELRKVKFTYRGSQTTTKKHLPQGFFSRFVPDEEKNKGAILVDLDDPFFKIIEIKVEAPQISYERYGIQSVNFATKYANKHEELIFSENNNNDKTIKFGMSPTLETSYQYNVQYHFKPDVGWDGEDFTVEVPWMPTEDRTQVLLPHKHIDFLDISVNLERNFYWGKIQEARVYLSYESPSGWQPKKVLRFYPESVTEQHWKLRLNDKEARQGQNPSYTYYIEYQMEDGSTQKTEPVTTDVPGIAINDLTVTKLPIEFVPLLNPNERAYIDVIYEDIERHFRWEKSLQLTANSSRVELEIPLMEPSQRTFRYELTLLRADGNVYRQSFPADAYRSPIIIKSGNELAVEVSPQDVNWDLVRRVTVELRYQDPQNQINEAETPTFNPGDQSFPWNVAIANATLKTYQWRAVFYTKDQSLGERGVVRYPAAEGAWESSTETALFLSNYQPKAPEKPIVEEGKLEVEVIPDDIDWNVVRRVTVNLRYQDAQNKINKTERKNFKEGDESFIWEIEIADNNVTTYQWQATFYMKDTSVGDRGVVRYPAAKDSWESTTEPVLFLDSYQSSGWVMFTVVDEDGNPVANEAYQVTLPDGTVRQGQLNAQGQVKLEGILRGTCTVSFPNVDANDWQQV